MLRKNTIVLIAIATVGAMATPTDVSAARGYRVYSASNHSSYRGGHHTAYRSAHRIGYRHAHRISYRGGYSYYSPYYSPYYYYNGPFYAVRSCPVDILCYVGAYPGFRGDSY
jgi:hypothetical protein